MTSQEKSSKTKCYIFGEFTLDEAGMVLMTAGEEVSVQRRVWDLMLYLVKNRDRVIDKDELQEAVWPGMVVTETALTRAIMKARRAVSDDAQDPRWIKTVHGRGYRFVGEVVEQHTNDAATQAGISEEADRPESLPSAGAKSAELVSSNASEVTSADLSTGRTRRLVRALAAYGAFAWLLNQGAALVWEAFEWDRQGQQMLLVASFLGAFLVAAVAWLFVFTADGLKRPDELERAPAGGVLSKVTIATLMVALGLSLYWNIRAPQPAQPQQPTSTTSGVATSVAVLPFRNFTGDSEFTHVSDGVAAGLLQGLTQLPGVRTVGRTSSFRFRDSNEPAQQIAGQLQAEHLFEGSVQRAGSRVRVDVALLDRIGERVWSERFDYEEAQLFELQDAITAAAVSALAQRAPNIDPRLEAAARRGRALRGTDSLQAYDAFLRAEQQVALRTGSSIELALQHYQEATAIDPYYALAWAGLAWCRFSLATFGIGERAEGMAAAKSAAQRAAGFDPMLAEPHRVLAEIHSRYEWRFDRAAKAIEVARSLSNSVDILGTQAGILSKLGRHDDAADLAIAAFKSDPLNAGLAATLTIRLLRANRFDAAEKALTDLLALKPTHGDRHWLRAQLELARDNFTGALEAVAHDDLEYLRLSVQGIAYYGLGREGESEAALTRLIETDADGAAFQIAEILAARGELQESLNWLERALAQRDPGVAELLSTPSLELLYSKPRFHAIMQELGLDPAVLVATAEPVADTP